jgi:hypothetical protein
MEGVEEVWRREEEGTKSTLPRAFLDARPGAVVLSTRQPGAVVLSHL